MKALVKATAGLSYAIGDVIVAKSDAHVWGGKEGLPLFHQLAVSGVTPEDFAATTEPERVSLGIDHPETGDLMYVSGKKRLKGLNLSLLPAGAQADLTNTGIASITKAEFDAAVVDR